MKEFIKGSCQIHGKTLLRYRHSTRKATGKKTEWYVCDKCLREQWKKATMKRRKGNFAIQKYNREYAKQYHHIRRCLSVYITLLRFIENKPE